MLWRESAEATATPVPDAPPVYQYGPALAALTERTYTRILTLPPQFLERVGVEGVSVLSPYLSDPSAGNLLRVADTFRRSGRDVVFTRHVTRLDEAPISFTTSQVRVGFRPLSGRAYDTEFEGRYTFRNSAAHPVAARFLFTLPQAGTIRELDVRVGEQAVTEPNDRGDYEWRSDMAPGEQREALVRYRVLGANSWHYDFGSRRRRVEQFRLELAPGGAVRFIRGSLQPTATTGGTLLWDLANVVTAQQIALSFPPATAGKETYLQALSALPVSLVLFLAGVLGLGQWLRQVPRPAHLAEGLLLFAFGLGASPVLANYLGAAAGLVAGPVAGALLAEKALGRRSLLAAVSAALFPAAFLSPQHTGLLVLALAVLALGGAAAASRSRPA
jgi:hypothetical protein